MKKRYEENTQYQHLINQLLTLYFSGVYITSRDMLDISQKLGFSMPSKSREILLKTLFLQCDEEGKIPQVCEAFVDLLQDRVQQYRALSVNFTGIHAISAGWTGRTNAVIRLLQQQKRGNPYT